jgi:hypothetical protein
LKIVIYGLSIPRLEPVYRMKEEAMDGGACNLNTLEAETVG